MNVYNAEEDTVEFNNEFEHKPMIDEKNWIQQPQFPVFSGLVGSGKPTVFLSNKKSNQKS